MKNRKAALLLVILLVLSLTAACANNPLSSTTASGSTTGSTAAPTTTAKSLMTPVGSYPIVNEKVTLELFVQQQATMKDYETNAFTLYLENLMGIDLKFQTAPQTAAVEKVNLLINSGTYPGVFLKPTPDVEKFGVVEGLLIDLTELIKTQMPNFNAAIKEVPDLLGQITSSDGKIYTLPSYNGTYHVTMSNKMWVNTSWLDKMKVPAPKTTDEFYQVCQQYLSANPKGIALFGANSGMWNGNPMKFMISAFTYYPAGSGSDYGLRHQSGRIDSVFIDPGYQEALKYLNKLYTEGLLYEGTFTMDGGQAKALVASAGEPVLFMASGYSGGFIDYNTPENLALYSHYYGLAPLKGPSGKQYVPYSPPSASNHLVITDACKYPEVAVRFADYFYTMDGLLTSSFGPESIGWKKAASGQTGMNGDPALYEVLKTFIGMEAQNEVWGTGDALTWATTRLRLGQNIDSSLQIFDPMALEKLLFTVTKENYEPYYQEDIQSLPRINLTADETQQIQTIAVELKNNINQAQVDFITGAKSADTDWDRYVTGLQSIGLDKLIGIYQSAYDRQYK